MRQRACVVVFALAVLWGAIAWGQFFAWGEITMHQWDYARFRTYVEAYREAVETHAMPLYHETRYVDHAPYNVLWAHPDWQYARGRGWSREPTTAWRSCWGSC